MNSQRQLRLFAPHPGLSGEITLGDVIREFLSHERARPGVCPGAAAERARILEDFAALHGSVAVSQARRHHLAFWVENHPGWHSDWTRKRILATVQRPFNWALAMELIDRNPFKGLGNRAGGRGRPITRPEFQAMLRHADALFRRVLVFMRWTGARPGEMGAARWSDLHLDPVTGSGWVELARHKTIMTQKEPRPRVIMLPRPAIQLLIWQRRHRVPGQKNLFINARGNPWNKNSLSLRIVALRQRANLPVDAKLYGTRHAYATSFLEHGGDIKLLAELLGHTSTHMAEHYVHLTRQHLARAVDQFVK